MPLSVKWYDAEHSIIIITITNDTTWNDYHEAIDWTVNEAAQVNHRVDIIFYDDVGMPRGNPMPHLSRGSTKIINQPNIYFSIIAGSQGSSGFARMMLETLAKTFMKMTRTSSTRTRGGILFLRTLDEALSRIKQDRIRSSIE
jgi:hypothetical protein